jgi:perosamine synthetase
MSTLTPSGKAVVDGASMIPVAKPLMDEAEVQAAGRAIRSGWVTQGPEVAAFEREFAAFVGAPHACAVSSGTTALHLALLAVGVRPGDEVITVSHSYIATANVIRYCGALPVFVDIRPDTFNMDPTRLEAVITPRTRAILCVHQIGMPCELPAIVELGKRRGLAVIEDAACAVGSEIQWNGAWEKIGRPHGDMACFSFHPRKLVSTGDGGMITTSNPEWDAALRQWRQHGMSVPDTTRHAAREVIFESYPTVGYNFRLTDIQAAVGREQLKRLPGFLERRRHLARRYLDALAGVPGLVLPVEPSWARTNWQSFCVRLPDQLDQKDVMQRLLDLGIASRRGVMCAHREAAYPPGTWTCEPSTGTCPCGPGGCRSLRESEKAQDRGIILPLYHQMTQADQDRIVAALRSICGASDGA